jgi:membrane-associated protein
LDRYYNTFMHHLKQRNVKIGLIILATLFLIAPFFNSELVTFFFNYLVLYRYATLFTIVFFAGLCVPIPMNVLLMGVGALSVQGHFNFSTALLLTVIANVSGDLVAFMFFRVYAHDILREKYVTKYPFFLRLEEHFKNHTYLAIFVSRIIGIFGTPVNFLSGMIKLNPFVFFTFDAIGNLVFAFLFLRIGYIVGENWITISKFVGTFMSVLSALIFILIIAFIFLKKRAAIKI